MIINYKIECYRPKALAPINMASMVAMPRAEECAKQPETPSRQTLQQHPRIPCQEGPWLSHC